MSQNPEYQIYPIDLSVSGAMEVVGNYTLLRIVWAGTRDAYGRPDVMELAAKVEVACGSKVDDFAPLGVNGSVTGEVGRYQLRWNSQPGVWAYLLLSRIEMGQGIDIDAPPAKQIVTSSVGTSVNVSAVSVGTAAVQLAPALVSRQSLIIQNLGASDIYIGGAAVTVATGVKVAGLGGSVTIDKTAAALYAISGTAGQDVRVLVEA